MFRRLRDSLRTVWDLSGRLVEVEDDMAELRAEWRDVVEQWGDTVDKLNTRIDRWRKREERALKAGLADDSDAGNHQLAQRDSPLTTKAELAAALRQGRLR